MNLHWIAPGPVGQADCCGAARASATYQAASMSAAAETLERGRANTVHFCRPHGLGIRIREKELGSSPI
eukprot:3847007-Pyramimonas_sp.AAC.1